jgi:3-oxoacyl-[acyl-carrier-protein] synthase-1
VARDLEVAVDGLGAADDPRGEALAREVFGQQAADQPMISATKSMTGHSLGGAGVQELIYSLIMMKERFVAPSINIDRLDPLAYGVNILREAREAVIKMVMSNSFGFGGTNATIVMKRLDA